MLLKINVHKYKVFNPLSKSHLKSMQDPIPLNLLQKPPET
jgi:hypothetical protein